MVTILTRQTATAMGEGREDWISAATPCLHARGHKIFPFMRNHITCDFVNVRVVSPRYRHEVTSTD